VRPSQKYTFTGVPGFPLNTWIAGLTSQEAPRSVHPFWQRTSHGYVQQTHTRPRNIGNNAVRPIRRQCLILQEAQLLPRDRAMRRVS